MPRPWSPGNIAAQSGGRRVSDIYKKLQASNEHEAAQEMANDAYFFEVPGMDYLRTDAELIASEFPELFESDGICARVKISLDQEAVMTRSAFNATLELGNNLDDASLTGVGLVTEQ